MDRRRFGKVAAALFVGKAVAESVARDDLLLLTDAKPSPVSWPASPITDEQIADAGGYLVHEDFVAEFDAEIEQIRHRLYRTIGGRHA